MHVVKPLTCKHCGTPLSDLARRSGSGICSASRCRHALAAHSAAQRQRELGAAVLQLAQQQVPATQPVPSFVVWLNHWTPKRIALRDDEREQHRSFLELVLEHDRVMDASALAPSTARDGQPQGQRLCAQCAGYCCEAGSENHAFIDQPLLQRWLDQNPGRQPDEAIAAYLDLLPSLHIEGSCLYQTDQGCAMGREMRSDTCNGFACRQLEQVQQACEAEPTTAFVAITLNPKGASRAVAIGVDVTQPLHKLPK